MKKTFYKGRFIFIPLMCTAFLALIGFIVMQLWNALLPSILGVTTITYWQAIGIFILCKILFGFGKGGRAPWMHRRDQMRGMSQEQKEKFKEHFKNRMCWKKENWEEKAQPQTDNNL